MKLHPNIKYRSDIDGLRAIAVLSVILFHINGDWIPGGFLGVDIFFVISGYLITLLLIREVEETDKINFSNFYKRRIKRILPALLFVLIPTFVLGFFFLGFTELLSLAKSMIWTIFSAVNIYFFSSVDSGYFASGSNELPLLHLWSLGVEEQFYLFWPLVILLLLRYIKSMKIRMLLLVILFLASLGWAHSIIVSNHSFAYYMLPTRVWELVAGAIVALLVYSSFKINSFISELMALLGILVIILSFIFVSESDPVPGMASLPIIIATALLILSTNQYQTFVGRILSIKLLVAIGLVSYSAYLWHWPILAYLHYSLIPLDISMSILVIFLTFILATISYFFIETPLRKNNVSTKKVFIFYFIFPALLISIFSLLIIQGINKKSAWVFPWHEVGKFKLDIQPTDRYKHNCQYRIFAILCSKRTKSSF